MQLKIEIVIDSIAIALHYIIAYCESRIEWKCVIAFSHSKIFYVCLSHAIWCHIMVLLGNILKLVKPNQSST